MIQGGGNSGAEMQPPGSGMSMPPGSPTTREALLSEAGFEKVFRNQNWVRRSKLFCRWFCFLLGQAECISVAA